MDLKESLYQDLKSIRYKQQFGKELAYPPLIETCSEIRTRCPGCKDYLSTDKDSAGNAYYECWTCGFIEYISPERLQRLRDTINEIPFD